MNSPQAANPPTPTALRNRSAPAAPRAATEQAAQPVAQEDNPCPGMDEGSPGIFKDPKGAEPAAQPTTQDGDNLLNGLVKKYLYANLPSQSSQAAAA